MPKTLPTDVASPCIHGFREAGSCVHICTACVYVLHAYSRVRACVFLAYAHDTPPRVQHFSAFHLTGTVHVHVDSYVQYWDVLHVHVCVRLGGMTSDVMKEDNALYGSPGADLVAMGDQVLPEEGGNMGGASSWDQFSNGRWSATEFELSVHIHVRVQ